MDSSLCCPTDLGAIILDGYTGSVATQTPQSLMLTPLKDAAQNGVCSVGSMMDVLPTAGLLKLFHLQPHATGEQACVHMAFFVFHRKHETSTSYVVLQDQDHLQHFSKLIDSFIV